jgi:hypothetical protein
MIIVYMLFYILYDFEKCFLDPFIYKFYIEFVYDPFKILEFIRNKIFFINLNEE